MRNILLVTLLLLSTSMTAGDSLDVERPRQSWLSRFIHHLSYTDTNYVEPQHYNWSAMVQGTYNYDIYRLSTNGSDGQSVTFSPRAGIKVGPYFGWRWVFLGYSIDLKNISFGSNNTTQGFDFSFYSAPITADIFYRHTRNNYRIRHLELGDDIDTGPLEGLPFDGIKVGITGVNLYYIFNHKRFSYPAAFNQSTRQKVSCGSWMAGVGYLRNSIDFDYEKLEEMIVERLGSSVHLNSNLHFNSIEYSNISASLGYAYNWVFARNFLFCGSLAMALAYKRTYGEGNSSKGLDLDLKNFNLDGIGRFGIVYNNDRWYAGTSAIVRAYNYKKSTFAANNIFGSLQLYVGYNFGARKAYKKGKNHKD